MKKLRLFTAMLCLLLPTALLAQQNIRGTVTNSATGEGAAAISIQIKNEKGGTYSDDRGRFQLRTSIKLPLTLVFSAIGFETTEVSVSDASAHLDVQMNTASILGQAVVVSASRTKQTKLSSPVTIEQLSSKDIAISPQLGYMEMMQGLKGVDVTVSSLGFTSVTTRGFNMSGNTNFTQIVDGMDNQAPGLNFPLGSVLGPIQLDVDNIELLSGASSALYGSRGLNGTMVTHSKNPFQYQGLSVMVTQGVNHVDGKKKGDPVPTSPYYDWAIRYANKPNEKFAYKVNLQYTQAKDWVANDMTNKYGPGKNYAEDPGYAGVNMYGDQTRENIRGDIRDFGEAMSYFTEDPSYAMAAYALTDNKDNYYVSRTGYTEHGFLNDKAKMFKANAELRYKFRPNLELIGSATYGTGDIVYTNNTRYDLKGFKIGQYRLELKSDNWFVRGYTTQENSGKAIMAGPTAQLLNEAWSPSIIDAASEMELPTGWYPDYLGALIEATMGGMGEAEANIAARAYADRDRPELGSPDFLKYRDAITSKRISEGGTLFMDRSKMYNAEGQYNFSEMVKFMDVIAGVNYRLYHLNSNGSLFPDEEKAINIKEYSGYLSLGKKVFDDALAINTSFRLDKNSLFKSPKLTSRASLVLNVAPQNYLRFSYQNAYSFPNNIQSLQNTMMEVGYFDAGGSKMLLNDFYQFDKYQPYTMESIRAYRESQNPADLKVYDYKDIKPQSVNSFELGYAALIGGRVMFDVLGYYSTWENFIDYAGVGNSPGSNDPTSFLGSRTNGDWTQYTIAVNGGQSVNTYGYAASVDVDLGHNFMTKVNYYSDFMKNKNKNKELGEISNFNTPKYHINMEFGNSGFGKKQVWSFSTALRYKPSYHYEVWGGLAQGTVPSSTVIDAQLSYKIIKARSGIRIGGTNILNKYYSTGMANPFIGAVYYVTYAYNIL